MTGLSVSNSKYTKSQVPSRVPDDHPVGRLQEAVNDAAERVSEWRDPDSNRGHHDFQTDVANARTVAERPANRPVQRGSPRGQVSRNSREDVGPIRTRQGSRVLIDPLLDPNDDGVGASLATAFRRKRAWLQLFARRSLLVVAVAQICDCGSLAGQWDGQA